MNKSVKVAVFFLVVSMVSISAAWAEEIDELVLDGNETRTIQGGEYNVSGGLRLEDNSSLTLIDAIIIFTKNDDAVYSVSGSSRLTAINCTLDWESPNSIQASDNSSIKLTHVGMYETRVLHERNYYDTGIGLSDNSQITVTDSKVGFIRLMENTECNVTGSHIGNFGSQSHQTPIIRDSSIEQIFLVYEKSRVQVNNSLTGTHEGFTQSQLVKAGEIPYELDLYNTTLLNPPTITVTDGKLEAHDTELDIVYIAGDSAIETENTVIYYLRLMDYGWAIIEDSHIEILSASQGDFNIKLENTTHWTITTYGTIGLNLKTNRTTTDYLGLNWAQPNTPQNIELTDTEIGELSLNMYSPQPIQCSNVRLTNLTLESGWGGEPPITITGSINFTPDAALNQEIKDGYTRIQRIYLIKATIDEKPAANTQLILRLDNQTRTITTNQAGEAVIPVNYLRHIEVISNPQPGGPYLINEDNLTKPVTITMNNQNYTIGILSDTPVTLAATSNTASERWEPDWSQYTPAAIILAIIAIIVYLYNSRRLESENRQIQ